MPRYVPRLIGGPVFLSNMTGKRYVPRIIGGLIPLPSPLIPIAINVTFYTRSGDNIVFTRSGDITLYER
jgi:hypothetical protein